MRRSSLYVACLVAVVQAATVSAHQIPGHLVLNGDLTAVVRTAAGDQRLTGRMNGYLLLGGSLSDGAGVEALNVAFFGVDQQMLTRKAMRGKPTGVVGFSAVTEGEKAQRLRFDPQTRSLVGEVRGRVDMSQLAEMTELKMNPEDDVVEVPTMEAVVEVRIGLDKLPDLAEALNKPVEARADVEMKLAAAASDRLGVPAFDLRVEGRFLQAQLVFWPVIEIARRLCVQPVRILSFNFPFFHFSGDGLAFGQPGAATQWAKTDVVFTYRDWITIFRPEFSTFSSDEAAALLATVNVDDCIEVFFVDRFSPQALFGGGATFGLGQASSKVISSDENADFGVDLTHLAHELGHVLNLQHPPSNASTNTLMCPSGFNNDNPKRNSQQNKNNLSNPLLTFAIKLVTAGPNCQSSADCGACP